MYICEPPSLFYGGDPDLGPNYVSSVRCTSVQLAVRERHWRDRRLSYSSKANDVITKARPKAEII
jgi:hypothetical protein